MNTQPVNAWTRRLHRLSLSLAVAGFLALGGFLAFHSLGSAHAPEEPGSPDNTPPTAAFTVDPTQGVVGTVFRFDPISSSDAEDSDAFLQARFDFDGDGTYDTSWLNPTNSPYPHSYSAVGSYTVTLLIQDTGGLTDTMSQVLQVGDPGSNTPPTAHCTATPLTGTVGTVFTFSAATSTDAQDSAAGLQAKWDIYGTGDFRGAWKPVTEVITASYNFFGIHEVDLWVIDSGALSDEISCQVEVVPPGGNTPPTAHLTISPTTGTITTTFTFDARGSTDAEDDISRLSVRFDWTNDGTYDTGWFNASQTWEHTYSATWGQIVAKAEVADSGGLTDTATVTFTVTTPYQVHLPLVRR